MSWTHRRHKTLIRASSFRLSKSLACAFIGLSPNYEACMPTFFSVREFVRNLFINASPTVTVSFQLWTNNFIVSVPVQDEKSYVAPVVKWKKERNRFHVLFAVRTHEIFHSSLRSGWLRCTPVSCPEDIGVFAALKKLAGTWSLQRRPRKFNPDLVGYVRDLFPYEILVGLLVITTFKQTYRFTFYKENTLTNGLLILKMSPQRL